MLNINKIHSLVNSFDFNMAKVSRGTGINYQTFKSKMNSDSWTPDDVEKLADFFKKPIAYFFDREEKPYRLPEVEVDVANDGNDCCRLCKEKDKQIALLEKLVGVLETGAKKETGAADSAQVG